MRGQWLGAGDTILFDALAAAGPSTPDPGGWRVPHPPLAPGLHTVDVANALGVARSRAHLAAVLPGPRPAASVASSGAKTRIAFDEVRGALFVANAGSGEVERYQEATGWSRQALAITGLRDAALTFDGQRIAAIAGGEVLLVDRDALAPGPEPPAPIPLPGSEGMDWRVAPMFGGRALLSGDGAGVTVFEQGLLLPAVSTLGAGPFSRPRCSASREGTLAVQVSRGSPSPSLWAMAGYQVSTAVTFDGDVVALDRTGSRILLLRDESAAGTTATLLLDGALAVLPGALPGTVSTALLNDSGGRALAWDPAAGRVRIFELGGGPDPGTGLFSEVGAPGVAPVAPPGAGVVMSLSADEQTLFLAGDQNVVLVPLH